MKELLIGLCLLISLAAPTLAAQVISVGDGDTVTLEC